MATVLLLLTVIHLATAAIVNEARGKPALMSSAKVDFNASTAVDGNTDAGGHNGKRIIDTGEGYTLAWWQVDLQREVQDATVRIYFRTDYTWRRNGVKLYTSTCSFPGSNPTSQGQLCHTVTGDRSGSDIPDVYNVTCPGRWRYLLLYTDTDNDKDGPVLDFGEVEVLICSVGTYGEDCTKTCSSRNCVTMTTSCERDGRCPGGCQSGWAGVDCTQARPPCTDNNYYGLNCDKLCSDRKCKAPSTSSCDRLTGWCDNGCEDGWRQGDCTQACRGGRYGPGCRLTCGQCIGDNICHYVTGNCPGDCKAGRRGPRCQQECESGQYGVNCAQRCGQCNGTCDHVLGHCPDGCLQGFCGLRCDLKLAEINDVSIGSIVAGACFGTFLGVILLVLVVFVCLIRQGRLQWVKSPEDRKPVQVSRGSTQMSNIAPQPASDHAQSSSHVYNNDYDVIEHKEYENA